jgi:hypothetical protein
VNAKPYQIDRMLWQLAQAGKLDGVRASCLARCSIAWARRAPELLDEVILRVFDHFQGPIAIGLRSGHVSGPNVTLTFGVEAELHAHNHADLHSAATGGDSLEKLCIQIHVIFISAASAARPWLRWPGCSSCRAIASPAPTRPPIRP